MKRHFTMLLALFAFSLSVLAGTPGVTFLLRSGQKVSFAFIEEPVIALSSDNFSVSVSGVERVRYAYTEVQRVAVVADVDDVVSAVDNGKANGDGQHVIFTLSANMLMASGLAPHEQLSCYTPDGKLVLTEKAHADGSVEVSLSALQQGVYVIRTQIGISYKFFKK